MCYILHHVCGLNFELCNNSVDYIHYITVVYIQCITVKQGDGFLSHISQNAASCIFFLKREDP